MYKPSCPVSFSPPALCSPCFLRGDRKSAAGTRGDACDVHSPTVPAKLAPAYTLNPIQSPERGRESSKRTYKRQSAVPARRNLGLVRVDEDLGVSRRTTASVAGHDPVVRPLHGLLVDQLDGGVRPGLGSPSVSISSSKNPTNPIRSSFIPGVARSVQKPTCSSKSVCSNRGPVMATARGRWLRDQISARFGACSATAVGAGPPEGTCAAVVVVGEAVLVVDEAASNWRGVAENVRFERCRAAAATRRREAYIVLVCGGLCGSVVLVVGGGGFGTKTRR